MEAFVNSDIYDAFGWIKIHSIEWLAGDLYFNCSLYVGEKQGEEQQWQLKVANCIDYNIDAESSAHNFEFFSDHPLLWCFTDERTELYITKSTDTPKELLADLYLAHSTLFNKNVGLEKYMLNSDLWRQCHLKYGLFAKGPVKILSRYFDCLEKAGSEPYFFGNSAPKHYNGRQWEEIPENLKIALLGSTYFIGTHFAFTRQHSIAEE